MQRFQKNRQLFPPEELARYAGKYIAWGPDGTEILASNDEELELVNIIRAAGYNSAEVLIAFVPAETVDTLEQWLNDMDALTAELDDPAEWQRIESSLAEADRQAKTHVRREMGLP